MLIVSVMLSGDQKGRQQQRGSTDKAAEPIVEKLRDLGMVVG